MDKNVILTGIGILIYFVIMIGAPVVQKKTLKSAGKAIVPFPKFDKARTVLIYVFSFVVIGLSGIPRFSLVIKLIFELCGIFGIYISSKESIFAAVSGLYENGLICPDGFFSFDDIVTLPVLNLSLEEQENYQKNSLILNTKSKDNVEIIFDNEEICEKVKAELFVLCPRLKPEN